MGLCLARCLGIGWQALSPDVVTELGLTQERNRILSTWF